MFFSRKFVSLLKASTFLAVLNLASFPVQAGKWAEYMVNGEIEKAKKVAGEKCEKYEKLRQHYNRADFITYTPAYFPELDAPFISDGIYNFINKKSEKWNRRWNSDPYEIKGLKEEAQASLSYKAILTEGPKNKDEWKQVLSYSLRQESYYSEIPYDWSQYQYTKYYQQLIEQLNFIFANNDRSKDKKSTDVSLLKTNGPLILDAMEKSIKNSVQRFQKLHSSLTQHLHNLMGIDPELLKEPFVSPSIAVVIDTDFRRNLPVNNKPLFPSSPWKQGNSLWEAVPYAHGDKMEALIKAISPQTTTLRFYAVGAPAPFQQSEYFSQLHAPVVFNCSFTQEGVYSLLQKTEKGIRFKPTNTDTEQQVSLIKDELHKAFPDKDCEGILDEKQLAFLREVATPTDPRAESLTMEDILRQAFPDKDCEGDLDDEQLKFKQAITANITDDMKSFFTGSGGDQPHLLVAIPSNDPGPLTMSEFHDGWIELFREEEVKNHGLIPLNFDFLENSLYSLSHWASEYKHMAVVVPAAHISISDGKDSLPYIGIGGHSSAAAILTGFETRIWGLYYPTLTYSEVRRAILEGANRTFAGYDPELHGQGMVNLTGALEVAKTIARGKTSSTASTSSVSSTSAATSGSSSVSSTQVVHEIEEAPSNS